MKKRYIIPLVILVILIGARIYLPFWVTDYVNKVLDDVPGYKGSISGVGISLYRGAYEIYDLNLETTEGDVPVPFLYIPEIDLSVQWKALFKGAIVGEIEVIQPKLNFVVAVSDSDTLEQTGVDTDWTKPIKELMPLSINKFTIHNGSIHYLDFSTQPKVDIYLDRLNATATNFSNVNDSTNVLPSKIEITGSSMGGGKLYITSRLNPLKEIPDLDMEAKFENAEIAAFNEFTEAYSGLDFHAGTINVYSEVSIKDGMLLGYVKPLVKDLDVVSYKEDGKNPLGLIWESVAGLFIEIFENQGKSQFATRVKMEGDLNNMQTSIWPIVGNIFKNAFISAFKGQTEDSIDYDQIEKDKQKEKEEKEK